MKQKSSIRISPNQIKLKCLSRKWQDRDIQRYEDGERVVGKVIDGDWDKKVEPYANCYVYRSLKDFYCRNKDWEDTLYPECFHNKLEWNGTYHGYSCWDKFKNEYLGKRIHKIYLDFKDGKVIQQAEPFTEIEVALDRDGNIIFVDGRHRMALAKILGVPYVFIVVDFIHELLAKKYSGIENVEDLMKVV